MTRTPGNGASRQRESAQDDLIMGTNSSSIVSKRSVERLYYPEPHFFRYFVKKPQRRSPLINRGYWMRMHAIENRVLDFLKHSSAHRTRVVINLGCGYDPLPFHFLAKHADCCQNVLFIDVDYELLMRNKRNVITQTPQLNGLLVELDVSSSHDAVLLHSPHYLAIGCDLRDTARLEEAIKSEISLDDCEVLFVAEVSLTYMEVSAADAVIAWAAGFTQYTEFCLLEQFLPGGADHPFATTMLKHFKKLQAPLRSINHYPSLEDQEGRFVIAGWEVAKATSLWTYWHSGSTSAERRELDFVESFDEWEEFALFCSHYFILNARCHASTCNPDGRRDIQRSYLNEQSKFTSCVSPRSSPLKLVYHEDSKLRCHRRYGALIPQTAYLTCHYGGIGQQSRLQSSDVYSLSNESLKLSSLPSKIAARMCHTVAALGDDECLLIGGRSSPDKAMADCWIRTKGGWTQVSDLPVPRYRHCATTATSNDGVLSVLVYGGKQNATTVLGDWLLLAPGSAWQILDTYSADGELPAPRFSASLICLEQNNGLLFGGLSQDGCVLHDTWTWKLCQRHGRLSVEFHCCSKNFRCQSQYKPFESVLCRFGAQVCPTKGGFVVVGGISTFGVHELPDEVVVVNMEVAYNPGNLAARFETLGNFESHRKGVRPLLVGHSLSNTNPEKLQIVGGGAVCFSFGTHWNEGTWTLQELENKDLNRWALIETDRADDGSRQMDHAEEIPSVTKSGTIPAVPRVKIKSAMEFDQVLTESQPTILESLDIGPCINLWTVDYLRSKVGLDRIVTVHESKSRNMNFLNKNFEYTRKKFGDFLKQIANGEKQYLRSISSDKPTDVPANLDHDFPEIAKDFRLPPELITVTSSVHSSPLRVSGPVTMWLHYDVMANVLCQIRGTKRLILYPPSDISELKVPPGASSSTISVFETGLIVEKTHPVEALLKPGDVLFIPPLWPHTAAPTENLSIAVNVFFRNLAKGYAAGRDVYGNRDLAAYENGRRDIARLMNNFKAIPKEMSRFYLERLADELKAQAKMAD